METRRVRLGDVIDDYCPRCRLIMNHGVVGMVVDEVRKVRCNTCQAEHVYKHGRLPARRRNATGKLFEEVLRGMGRQGEAVGHQSPEPSAEEGAPPEEEAAVPAPDDEPRTTERQTPEPPAATQPKAETLEPRDDAPLHGVRRKLYTIRRHTGGKPPGGGAPKG